MLKKSSIFYELIKLCKKGQNDCKSAHNFLLDNVNCFYLFVYFYWLFLCTKILGKIPIFSFNLYLYS